MNILRNLIEETPEDIKKAIDNLYDLRFYLQNRIIFITILI